MGWPLIRGTTADRIGRPPLPGSRPRPPAPASSKGALSAAPPTVGPGKVSTFPHPRPSHVQAPPAAAPSPWRPVPTSPPPRRAGRGLRRSPAAASGSARARAGQGLRSPGDQERKGRGGRRGAKGGNLLDPGRGAGALPRGSAPLHFAEGPDPSVSPRM